METITHTPDAPWTNPEAFPEKPSEQEFGYVSGRKLTGCSFEELVHCCGSKDIQLVWYPDAPRILPADQVPFLVKPLKKRAKSRYETRLWIGMANLVMFGFSTLVHFGYGAPGSFYFSLMMLVALGVLPVFFAFRGLNALKRADGQTIEPLEGAGHFSAWVGSKWILFTWILLGAIIVVSVLQMVTGLGHSIQAAGLDKQAVRRGEWWRLLTGPMMHGGVYHLLFNALTLLGLGRLIETLATRYHLALVFAISAFSGSLCSLYLLPKVTSVGASGGLLGMIGFLGVLGLRRKAVLPAGFVKSIGINIAIIAAMGIIAFALIDNAAHFGGLVGGVVTGFLLVNRNDQALPLPAGPALKIAGTLALVVMLGFAGYACVRILAH